jgi:hypothetical protein
VDAGTDEGEGGDGSGCSVREKVEEGTKRVRQRRVAPLLNGATKNRGRGEWGSVV